VSIKRVAIKESKQLILALTSGRIPLSVPKEMNISMTQNIKSIIRILPLLILLPFTFSYAEEVQSENKTVSEQLSTNPLILSTEPAPPEAVSPISKPSDLELVSVEDISDRAYLNKVMEMIQGAKESIDISMYVSNPKVREKHPVGNLFQALVERAANGVSVRIWFNSALSRDERLERTKYASFWNDLEQKGVKIQWVSSERLLHDKLVVIDREYVVEGSTNWTYSALLKNHESATLIRSKKLANKKIERLEALPLEKREELGPLQTTFVDLPVELFTHEAYLPKVANEEDREAWDLYFYLVKLRTVQGSGPWDFGVSQLREALSWSPGKSEKKDRAAVSKVLRRLEKDYRLVSFEWIKKKNEVSISLLEPGQVKSKKSKTKPSILGSQPWKETLRIPLAFYEYGYQKKWSLPAQFAYCISLISESESQNKSFWFFSMYQLQDRFHVNKQFLRQGFTQLKRDNAIEFVFPKKAAGETKLSSRQLISYQNNILRSEEENETEILKVRNRYASMTPEEWNRARSYAEIFDDPYDPLLIRQFVGLMKKYPESTLEPLIMKVAQFAPDNSLRSPEFIKQNLERK